MANVVAGAVTDPPPEAASRPGSARSCCAGLSTDPRTASRRWPSCWPRSATIRPCAAGAGSRRRGGGLLAAGAAGAHRFTAGQRAVCAGGPGRAATAWGPERRAAIERAFAASGNKNAARAFAAARRSSTVRRALDRHVHRGLRGHPVRGEQSAEVLDLRMGCLGERLSSVRALGDVFLTADSGVVDNAVGAAGALPALDRCADVADAARGDQAARRSCGAGEGRRLRERGGQGQRTRRSLGSAIGPKRIGTTVLMLRKRIGYAPLAAEAVLHSGSACRQLHVPATGDEYLEERSGLR